MLEIAQRELVDYQGTGVSVMGSFSFWNSFAFLDFFFNFLNLEISHRSAAFSKIILNAENNVRELLYANLVQF